MAEPATTNRFTSEWSEIETEAALRASFNAWAVTGGIDSGSLNRTMTFDNLFVRKTHQLVPAYRMEEPPAKSHYIITAIEVGHLVQARFQRERSALSAHLAVRIKQLGGETSALESELGVHTRIYALGVDADTGKGPLRPLTEAQFVSEFSANERAAVPVRVRYTPIRGRALRDGDLEWARSYREEARVPHPARAGAAQGRQEGAADRRRGVDLVQKARWSLRNPSAGRQ